MRLIPFTSYFHPSPFDDFFDLWETPFPSLFDPTFHRTRAPRPTSDVFRLKLDVSHYNPENISVRVVDNKIEVSGKQHVAHSHGHDSSEFTRSYQIPSNVDASTLKHFVNNEGCLVVEANKIQPERRVALRDDSTDEKLVLVFDALGYEPGEINISVNNNVLKVCGTHKSTQEQDSYSNSLSKFFCKEVTLGPEVVVDSIKPVMRKDGYLVVEATKDQSKLPACKKFQITHE